jgi:hypothetical protein
MTRKRQASLESLFDEAEPYLRLFARLLIIYCVLRLCRAIGMRSIILDWMEHGDLAVTGLTFGVFLLDNVIQLFVNLYEKRVASPSREKE